MDHDNTFLKEPSRFEHMSSELSNEIDGGNTMMRVVVTKRRRNNN